MKKFSAIIESITRRFEKRINSYESEFKKIKGISTISGIVTSGSRHFEKRITTYGPEFEKVTGGKLFPGTINVKVNHNIKVKEDFRLIGKNINEPDQDLIFEKCLINGIKAFRIRPLNLHDGSGGHGDNILEISSFVEIPNVHKGRRVEVTLFR